MQATMNLFLSAIKYLNTPCKNKQSYKIIETYTKNEIYQDSLDCIGLILLSLHDNNHDISQFFEFITDDLYRNISYDKYLEIIQNISNIASVSKANTEIKTNDILVFFINQKRIHFAISNTIDENVEIIHSNLMSKKVSIENLDLHLKKYLVHKITFKSNEHKN